MSREMAVNITAVASTLGFIISFLSDTPALMAISRMVRQNSKILDLNFKSARIVEVA